MATAAGIGFGHVRVPNVVEVGLVAVVGYVDFVAADLPVLVMEGLMDVADDLAEVSISD